MQSPLTYEETLPDMILSSVQESIFKDRYAATGERKPEEMWRRVAKAVAAAENNQHMREIWEPAFYSLLRNFRYVPGGRILSAMGTDATVTAQNCYVIPSPEDSRHGILRSFGEWVEIQSKGGGVGINISSLRPRGAEVKSVQGTSSGPVNWSQLFSFVSHDIIIQGGSRRGAAMIMMDVGHPDIQEFIHAKEKPGVLEGCNISVCISDEFMKAVKSDDTWHLAWGTDSEGSTVSYKSLPARELWDEICEAAWKSAEPGIYFIDRANYWANSSYFETLIASNPCGEQPLGPYGACLLGSFNLPAFTDENGNFDWDLFDECVYDAVRFNDNVIEASHYPLPECEKSQKLIRRMGMGIMGLADVLIQKKLRYGSPDAIDFTEEVYRRLRDRAYEASAMLAKERGAFPVYAPEYLEQPFIKGLTPWTRSLIEKYGIRNCYLTTQAPTGTTSLLAGVNGGIEPYFQFEYERKDRIGDYDVVSKWAREYTGSDVPSYMVTAMDITPEEHVLMQAAAQQYNDSAISKTVNAPESHTVDDVKRLYMMAYDHGLKSISYYRDNSRQEQVLNRKEPIVVEEVAEVPSLPVPSKRRKLPATRQAISHRAQVDGATLYITSGLYDDGQPGEVFLRIAKTGSTLMGMSDFGFTMMSIALQHGATLEECTEKMIGTQFEPSGMTDDTSIPKASSVLDYVGKWLNDFFVDGAKETRQFIESIAPDQKPNSGITCGQCGRQMIRQEGCLKCICGNSKC